MERNSEKSKKEIVINQTKKSSFDVYQPYFLNSNRGHENPKKGEITPQVKGTGHENELSWQFVLSNFSDLLLT